MAFSSVSLKGSGSFLELTTEVSTEIVVATSEEDRGVFSVCMVFFLASLQELKQKTTQAIGIMSSLDLVNFNDFSDIVSKIEKNPLPGVESHFKMAHPERAKVLSPTEEVMRKAKKAAVLAAFYPGPAQETHLLFIKRQGGSGIHAKQIAFPGGKAEVFDKDLLDTAIREAQEEVGIVPANLSKPKALTPVYIPPSNFLVQPYMALYDKWQDFVPQLSEVHSLLEIPLHEVVSENNTSVSRLSTSYATDIEVPSFVFRNEIVWGATAMMLNEIRSLLKEVL